MAFIIKVTIEDTHPPVWRKIAVPEGIGFADLHRVLQIVFNWKDMHTHEFTFPTDGIQLIPHGAESHGRWEFEDKASFEDFLSACTWMRYTYDCGDKWQHKIELDDVDDSYPKDTAVVIKAKGDSFAEDGGGRIPFDLKGANDRLQKLYIKKARNSKKADGLIDQMQIEKLEKDFPGVKGKDIYNRLMQMAEELEEWEEPQELFFDDSVRGKMISGWRGLVDETIGENKGLSLKLQDAEGTMEEALGEHGEDTLEMYGRYLQMESALNGKPVTAQEITGCLCENPQYFLYVLNDFDYGFLKRLQEMPAKKSVTLKKLEEADAVIRGITLGLLNVNLDGRASRRTADISFTKDARAVFEALQKEQPDKVYKDLAAVSKQLVKLVHSYGMMEIGMLREQASRMCRTKWETKDLNRVIYWHLCFMRELDFIDGGEKEDYILMPYVHADSVMEDWTQYGAENVPFKKLSRKELTSDIRELCVKTRYWNHFAELLQRTYECSREETEYVLDKMYAMVQDGFGAQNLWMELQEDYPLEFMMTRSDLWTLLMDICMKTPLPMLKAHTREEYARLTGKEPWELGLIRQDEDAEWDEEWNEDEEWDEDEDEEWDDDDDWGMGDELYAMFKQPPQLQYQAYRALTGGDPEADRVKIMEQVMAEAEEKSDDLVFLLGLAYLQEGKLKRGIKVLESLENDDAAITMMLNLLYNECGSIEDDEDDLEEDGEDLEADEDDPGDDEAADRARMPVKRGKQEADIIPFTKVQKKAGKRSAEKPDRKSDKKKP